jgi:hypothetical protein
MRLPESQPDQPHDWVPVAEGLDELGWSALRPQLQQVRT